MNQPNSQPENPKERRYDPELLKKGLRCDLDQYDMLKRCSDKKDMTEWNEWRKKNLNEEIFLEGANLNGLVLCPRYYPKHKRKGKLFLKENEDEFVNLSKAYLREAELQRTILDGANLEEAELPGAYLNNSTLVYANLKGADLMYANLENAVVSDAFLQGTTLERCDLRNTSFAAGRVDACTIVWKPKVSRWQKWYKLAKNHEWMGERYCTHFEGVPLETLRIDPKTKQLLEYNIRRNNWENWYKYVDPYAEWVELRERSFLVKLCLSLIRGFWGLSDYGRSTGRIILGFFGLALVFGLLYWLYPSCVMANSQVGDIRGLWHALYFSVVTMTTLGFGDIAANPDSWLGQTLLMVQVILGYVLLGALVTRFAVLFTAGGPAGKFADEKGQTTDDGRRMADDRRQKADDGEIRG